MSSAPAVVEGHVGDPDGEHAGAGADAQREEHARPPPQPQRLVDRHLRLALALALALGGGAHALLGLQAEALGGRHVHASEALEDVVALGTRDPRVVLRAVRDHEEPEDEPDERDAAEHVEQRRPAPRLAHEAAHRKRQHDACAHKHKHKSGSGSGSGVRVRVRVSIASQLTRGAECFCLVLSCSQVVHMRTDVHAGEAGADECRALPRRRPLCDERREHG